MSKNTTYELYCPPQVEVTVVNLESPVLKESPLGAVMPDVFKEFEL